MTLDWRPVHYQEADADELVELCQLQPAKVAAITSEYIRWLHHENPAGRAQLGVAKEIPSDRIIGLKWLVPLLIQVNDEVRLGAHSCYVLVHPDYRRQGVFTKLVTFCNDGGLENGYQFWYGIPSPSSHPLFVRRLGWADIGQARLFIRPLNMGQLVASRLGRGMVQGLLAAAGRASGGLLFRPRPPGADAARIAVEPMDTQGPGLDDFWERVRRKHAVMVVRDTRFLHWRYTEVPGRAYQGLVARQNDLIIATIVLRNVIIEGVSCGMVVDFLVEPTERGRLGGELLLREAAAHFLAGAADLAGCLMVPHAEETALLRRQGYLMCPVRLQPQPFPVILFTDNGAPERETLYDLRSWFLTMGDFDAV